LGPEHPHTLIDRGNLAISYRDVGRLQEALELHERVLADRERVLGPDHPDTLIARNNVAHARSAVQAVQHLSTATTTTVPSSEHHAEQEEKT
ncbi:tetratricopeptide repeat protein, partial [Streptomyces anthocyanicus]